MAFPINVVIRVLELPMTATRCDELPPIAVQEAKQVTDPSAEQGDACTQYSLG